MKKFGIIFGSVVGVLYILFLALPLILSPILNSFSPQIADMVKESTGFNAKFEKLGVVTTPKLTAGIKAGSVQLSLPTGEIFFKADKFSTKLSILPLLIGRIELDDISLADMNANLKVRQDGHFLLEEYIPQPDPDDPKANNPEPLPFGFKLSNRLPNMHLKNYDITFVDMPTSKKYTFSGKDIDITDFVLDKRVKIAAKGNITLDGDEQFVYDVKVLNHLMPQISLNDMVFNPEPQQEQTIQESAAQQTAFVNVVEIFKSLHKTGLTANLNANIKTSGSFEIPIIEGICDVEKLSVLVDGQKLPEGYVKVKAHRHNINVDGNLYSSQKDNTTLSGKFNTGKNKSVDMSFKSNAQIHDLFRIVNSLAKSFNYNDLETLSATGSIDSDFNLKMNKHKVSSKGYLRIPSASINYGLYDIAIKNIVADIDFNNMMNIKNIELSILGQPLKIYGTVQQNSETDVHITANKLSIKGLVAAAGQVQALKENSFNSGTLSMDALIKGRFDKLTPTVNLDIANLDIKNRPSDTRITMPDAKLIVNTDGKAFKGNLTTNQLRLINPMLSLSIPETTVDIGEKDINIKAYLMLNNSRIDITGSIKDYISDKLKIDIKANGSLLANDIKTIIPKDFLPFFGTGKGRIPLNVNITGNAKTQDITVRMEANPSNYYTILDIAELKGHKTLITSDIKLIDDSARLSNTGIYIDTKNNAIAKLDGNITALSKNQKLNMRLSVPTNINMVVPGMPKSNMRLRGDIDITGTSANPHLKGLVSIPSITIPDMFTELTNLVANLNGPILKGNSTLEKLKFGGIVAENIACEFLMKNYSIVYLNNILGDAFDGKISGNISYGLTDGKITANMTGSGMNAVKTIEGAAGMKNALSGTLGFKADIATKGVTDVEMMKHLTGKASFDIQNGKFLNVGRFDTLLYAQNILGNAILKTLVTSFTNVPIIQNTAEFKTVDGSMTFSNGWAKLNPIRTSGPLMSYYITGDYNLLNGTTNVIILGRLDEKVVAALGGLGDLSVDKLTSYIPSFGALTGQIIKTMTADPKNERTDKIPALSTGSDKYKDFKVVFNGGVESKSSVKSFKWLSECDVSAIDYKQEVQNTINSFKDSIQNTKKDYADAKEEFKNSVQETKQQIEDAKQQLNELKNLFKF